MRNRRPLHPLEHHPSFRAAIEAAPAVAELSAEVRESELLSALVIAVSDLVEGFVAPPDSRRRTQAHHRAWSAVRDLDRKITVIGRRRLATPATVRKAQRAIDRADVMIGALLTV
jgi:hypothetical protein